jgi:hypothetical protein
MNIQINRILVSLGVLASLAMANVVFAETAPDDQKQPEVVSVPLTNAYIPKGFDSNDRVRLMVEGYFPSTCYRVREAQIDRNDGTIGVTQTAFKYNGPCLWMMVSYSQPVNVGILKSTTYSLKDQHTGRTLGQLPVRMAANSGPDDFLYANVKEAYVGFVDGTKRAIVISGVLPGDCWILKEKKVFEDGKNVLTVLPILEKIEKPQCNDYEMPFVSTVDIPAVAAGRYMLQVRSLNGESVIKLVDL